MKLKKKTSETSNQYIKQSLSDQPFKNRIGIDLGGHFAQTEITF